MQLRGAVHGCGNSGILKRRSFTGDEMKVIIYSIHCVDEEEQHLSIQHDVICLVDGEPGGCAYGMPSHSSTLGCTLPTTGPNLVLTVTCSCAAATASAVTRRTRAGMRD